MHWTVRSALRVPMWLMLLVMAATAYADGRIKINGEYWESGMIQTFDPATGVVVIDDRRFQLTPGALAGATDEEASSTLGQGRGVIYRESYSGGSTGTGSIKEIRAFVH